MKPFVPQTVPPTREQLGKDSVFRAIVRSPIQPERREEMLEHLTGTASEVRDRHFGPAAVMYVSIAEELAASGENAGARLAYSRAGRLHVKDARYLLEQGKRNDVHAEEGSGAKTVAGRPVGPEFAATALDNAARAFEKAGEPGEAFIARSSASNLRPSKEPKRPLRSEDSD